MSYRKKNIELISKSINFGYNIFIFMKKIKHILTLSFLLIFLCSFTGITEDVATALKSGSAFKLSKFFQEKIDLTILDDSDLIGKLEAERKLYAFFHENHPSNFEILHQGESKSGLEYTIGKLVTSNGNYRVSYYIKKTADSEFIQQIIIDTE
jgi:hypothetical protein